MHSHLRNQSAFEPFSAHNTAASYPHAVSPRPEKKQKMGIAQTYRLAHRARGKLSFEASRGDHDLRLLVGHANLLDSLMIELQDAERDQEAWFNQTVSVASTSEEPKRVQWSDSIVEQHRLDVPDSSDDDSEDSESDSEGEFEEEVKPPHSARVETRRTRARSPPARPQTYEDDSDDEDMESDDEYDNLSLSLVRTRSHSATDQEMAVPELVHDSSDDSDDESTPSSPESMDLDTEHIIVKDFAAAAAQQKQQQAAIGNDFYLPSQHQQAPMVAAY